MLNIKWYIYYLFVLFIQLNNFLGSSYEVEENNNESGPIVEIKDGKLEGTYMETRYGRKIMSFLGIPYAKPPINNLRFKDSEPVDPWPETYQAVNDVPECTQKYFSYSKISGTEDCLYLNVFTPQLPEKKDKLFPVMVIFHRGGWYSGSASTVSYGPNLLLDQDIVLVVPNYRLGPFGFLSTYDDVVPGNMGLKDQVLALKWVQKNIAKFGGDPNSVTIFGSTAGAGSVHYHMLSSMSKGLFHRAIANSGNALCPWAVMNEEGKENTMMLAKSLNCPTNNSEEIVECLRKIDAYDIIAKYYVYEKWNVKPTKIFKPIIEHDHPNAFISEQARKIIMEGKINSVNFLTGITSADGAIIAAPIIENPELIKEYSLNFNEVLPITLGIQKLKTEKVKQYYFDGTIIGNDSIKELVNLYTDALFGSCVIETVKLHTKYGTEEIYVYYFDYEGSHTVLEKLGIPLHKYGVNHADELFYLFPQSTLSDADNKMADVMTELWANFAKTGKPTLKYRNIWEPVLTENVEYLHIKDNKNLNMENNLLKDAANFWLCLLTKNDNIVKNNDCMKWLS